MQAAAYQPQELLKEGVMTDRSPPTFGIEEEYFLTDLLSRRMPRQPVEGFAAACQMALGNLVTREMFAAQFEVVTPVLHNLDDARECLSSARPPWRRWPGSLALAWWQPELSHWRSGDSSGPPAWRGISRSSMTSRWSPAAAYWRGCMCMSAYRPSWTGSAS